MEKIPEKFLNDDGTLNSDSLLKSYSELQKKIGSMVSVPGEDADKDAREKFNRAIGVPTDSNEYPNNSLFDDESVRSKFHDIGLTVTQVEKIYEIANEFLSPVLSEIFQAQQESTAMIELKNFFGDEYKMKDALSEINTFGEKFLPAEAFEALCATPQGIQSIYKMMQSMEPSVKTQTNVSDNFTDSDLRRMMSDPKYWRDKDPEYIRKIETGFKKLYS
jgi:hypothetical protein